MEATNLLVLSNKHKDVSWRTHTHTLLPLPPGPLIWFSHMSPSNMHNCRSKQTPSNTPMTSSITHQVQTELCMKPDVHLDRTLHILDMPIQLGSKGTAGELDPCDWKNWSAVIFHRTQIGFPTECNVIPVSARDALIDRWRTTASHPPLEKLPNSHSIPEHQLKCWRAVQTLLMDLKGQFTQKTSVCHHLLALRSFQTCKIYILQQIDSLGQCSLSLYGKTTSSETEAHWSTEAQKNERHTGLERWQKDHVWVNDAFNHPICS